ncbi:MAG: hypothetical protein ABSG83_13880 [Roseiarcus sp.]|jgi:hypothetical protein
MRFGIVLLWAGALILIGAIGWWWLTYRDVIGFAYISAAEAGTCLVGDSEICRLARALCRGAHPVSLINYRAAAFWIGLAALSSSLLAFARGGEAARLE